MNIAILICCYNRKVMTMRCLEELKIFNNYPGIVFDTFLLDDGSTDGTYESVVNNFKNVFVTRNIEKPLFWNRSMSLLFSKAISQRKYDGYILLNDDTLLYENYFSELIEVEKIISNSIVVGLIKDLTEDKVSYGGLIRPSPYLRPFFGVLVSPNGSPQSVDMMNGNVVLIPSSVVDVIGGLDPIFEHAMGDIDYALRAKKRNIPVVTTRTYVGECSRNSISGTFRDGKTTLVNRIKQAFSPKGLPWKSWLTMCWRHGGLLWPLHFSIGYIKILLK